tara:strand:+ start:694 stop:831 length:138 start_codon:yes stop_codon:yes gene_type:complete
MTDKSKSKTKTEAPAEEVKVTSPEAGVQKPVSTPAKGQRLKGRWV